MQKLLPLFLLVACADPNAELLAKYKNLEIDYNALNLQFETVKRDHEQWSIIVNAQLSQCRSDLKQFVCGKMSRKSVDYRVLCGETLYALPDSEEE